VAKSSPVWISHTLQYAMTGGYSTPSSGGTQTQTHTTPDDGGDQGFVQVPDDGNQP
jgi:hypothetical protein